VDSRVILDRFGGPTAAQTWVKDGHLVIEGIFDYLDHPKIRAFIDWEFGMHAHHEQPHPDLSRQGWMRHMYYSLIQQLVRQDPVWYILVVATRPDRQWRLMSYPYLAKETRPSESTGFLHLDINVETYLETGQGGNLISSGMALDDEDDRGCTVVVPGFHHHIRDWCERLRARGTLGGGATTNCNSIYTAEDRRSWGPPRPAPCKAFGLRLTHPAIIHGSTGSSTRRRRSLFAWHTSVCKEDGRVDNPDILTPDLVAACHRDRLIPPVQPNGLKLRHPVPAEAFGASLLLRVQSPLANALIGARSWTDPEVIREAAILRGPEMEKAWELVHEIRRQLVEAYEQAVVKLQRLEKHLYGDDAFFQDNSKTPSWPEAMDLSSG
jgi:hypothetical protein